VRRFLLIPAVVVGAVLVYAVFDDGSGLRTWLRLGARLRASQDRIQEIQRENAALRREAEGLGSDSLAIERAIREDLGFARRGEVVVRLPRDSGPNARIP
jgi:cell division protein FtsB